MNDDQNGNVKNKRSASILIVDDVPQNLQVLGNILSKEDFRISAVVNGKQALVAAEKKLPDLILLDVMMPEMDGYETCANLKKSPLTRHIPVVFLTAKSNIDVVIKGFGLGAVDYILKPFNPAELLARVKTHLEVKFARETILKQSDDFKELIHILCHDLMNPIHSIKGFFDLIVKNESLLHKLKDDVFLAADNSIAIIDLVRKMRVLEENKQEIKLESINLAPLVQNVITILHHKSTGKQLNINTDVDDRLTVLAERTSFINSVLSNILSNAIKFSFPGSEVNIKAVEKDDQVIIAIRDFGIGMPESLLDDVFDIHKDVSRIGTEGEVGTGYGMPLVKKFVKAYGGEIQVSSKEKDDESTDHGTEITLYLKKG